MHECKKEKIRLNIKSSEKQGIEALFDYDSEAFFSVNCSVL